jgi:hypothetical protein
MLTSGRQDQGAALVGSCAGASADVVASAEGLVDGSAL